MKEALGKDEKAEAAARKVYKSSVQISPFVIGFRSSVSRSFETNLYWPLTFSFVDPTIFDLFLFRAERQRRKLMDFRATVARIGRLHKEVQTSRFTLKITFQTIISTLYPNRYDIFNRSWGLLGSRRLQSSRLPWQRRHQVRNQYPLLFTDFLYILHSCFTWLKVPKHFVGLEFNLAKLT